MNFFETDTACLWVGLLVTACQGGAPIFIDYNKYPIY